MKRFIHILSIVCGAFILAGLLTSCGKETKVVVYQLVCDTVEFTQPQTIKDSEVQNLYLQFLEDLSKLGLNKTWQAEVVNDKFSAEDAKAEALYQSHLPKLKELEAAYKKAIGNLGPRSESSIYAKVVYKLSKSIPADAFSERLQEYAFELKYN